MLGCGLNNIDLWRSEEMQLVQLMIPAESAHDTMAALGDVGLLQFKDLSSHKSAFQRTYANQVKRCDEMARKLRFLGEHVEKSRLPVTSRGIFDKTIMMDELEAKLEEIETEVIEVNDNNQRLSRTHAELVELQLLLKVAAPFFDSAPPAASLSGRGAAAAEATPEEESGAPLLDQEGPGGSTLYDAKVARLGFVAGLIAQEKAMAFERLIFRATRGNMYLRQAPVGKVQDPASGEPVEKTVFVVFFSGERARTKINKICEAYSANRYPFPEELSKQRQTISDLTTRLQELHTTLDAGARHKESVLATVAQNLESWSHLVRREKAIYHTLNKASVDHSRKVLLAEAWVPSNARASVHEALRAAMQHSSTQVNTIVQPIATHDQPPTYFRTNKFTECFQTIVDAYGVARYREVNPAVFTIMTFPFLFAVMFGDLGHGILMLLFASYLLINERKFMRQQLDDMFSMAFGGRYCIFLMALFSLYMGFMYNEFFSMPMTAFGPTSWKCVADDKVLDIDPRECGANHGELSFNGSQPYPLGIDPIWHGTKTELPFLNSVKMKMSILVGVTHMNLGILMSLFNHLYFRDYLSIVCEFIPQMLFLNGLFGYLSVLIVYKWITGSIADLYHVMIYMFLKPGTMDDAGRLFEGQAQFQLVLLAIALVAVPWMLFPKPFILKRRAEALMHSRRRHSGGDAEFAPLASRDDDADLENERPSPPAGHGGGGHGEHGEVFDFSEVIVHQMIHTIEFVLGAVSNTASYLRLWALSLAHSQLSAVFYDRVLMASIASGSIGGMFIGFFVFFIATLGVLMVMESLSAFLHALRLHWVEFQNKFYRGDGYKFEPFSFAAPQDTDAAGGS